MGARDEREERLAAQLRANLKKRKDQARSTPPPDQRDGPEER